MKLPAIVTASMLLATPVLAAGGGASAGGAGHQRAINTGMIAGEKGPAGAPNNPRPAPPRDAGKDAPAGESVPAR